MKLSTVEIWIMIALLCAMVVVLRCSFLVLPRRFQPRGALAEALGYAPLAALVAICAPEIAKFRIEALAQATTPQTWFAGLGQDWRLWSALALILVMLLSRNHKRSALFGLAAAALVSWLM